MSLLKIDCSNKESTMAESNVWPLAGNGAADVELVTVKQEDPVIPVEVHTVASAAPSTQESTSRSTQRQTENAVKTFRMYLRQRNLCDDFESMTDQELDQSLAKYYPEMRMENGERYQKSSFAAMRHALNRYTLATMRRDIMKDPTFSNSQRVFKAVCRDLKKYGKDFVAHYPSLEKNDWVRMCKYFLHGDTPTNVRLLHKVFIDLMLNFGKEMRKDLHKILKTDFEEKYDEDGKMYVTIVNGSTHPSEAWSYRCRKMYAKDGDPLCPVKSLMEYKSHLHPGNSRLFQRPFQGSTQEHALPKCWYSVNTIGIKSLTAIMKRVSKIAKLSRQYTTHSLRVSEPHDISAKAMQAMFKVLEDVEDEQQYSSDSGSEDGGGPSAPPRPVSPERRFGKITEEEFKQMEDSYHSNNDKTQRSNTSAANQFRAFLKSIGWDEDFVDYKMPMLNEALILFFQNARKEDGAFYKTSSLKSFHFALNRYLKGPPHHKDFDLRFHPAFQTSCARLKQLCEEYGGGDDETICYIPISETDMLKMYTSPLLSTNHPKGLYNKVMFELRLLVCGSTFEKFHFMEKDYFVVEEDKLKKKRYVQRNWKSHRWVQREFGRMYEMPDSPYCPVASFEMYLRKLNPDCPYLWQIAKHIKDPDFDPWYANARCGDKTITRFISRLSQACKLSQVYNNKNLRATDPKVLIGVLNKLNKARIVFVKKPITSTAAGRQNKDEKISAETAQKSKQSNIGLANQQPSPVKYQIDPEWKKMVLMNTNLSQVADSNNMMLVPVKPVPQEKQTAKVGLSAKIMAQYRQIACKSATTTAALPSTMPKAVTTIASTVLNVAATPSTSDTIIHVTTTMNKDSTVSTAVKSTPCLSTTAGIPVTADPCLNKVKDPNDMLKMCSLIGSDSPMIDGRDSPAGPNPPLNRKRGAVERPVTRSRTKLTKFDSPENDQIRLKSVKIGNQIVFQDTTRKSSFDGKMAVSLLKNRCISNSSNLERNGSTRTEDENMEVSSDIKIEIVDDGYNDALWVGPGEAHCGYGQRPSQNNEECQSDTSDPFNKVTEEEESLLLMEVDDHVSLGSDDYDDDDDDDDDESSEEGLNYTTVNTTYSSVTSIEDGNTRIVKQEPGGEMFIVSLGDKEVKGCLPRLPKGDLKTSSIDEQTTSHSPIKQEVTMTTQQGQEVTNSADVTHVLATTSAPSVQDKMRNFLNRRKSAVNKVSEWEKECADCADSWQKAKLSEAQTQTETPQEKASDLGAPSNSTETMSPCVNCKSQEILIRKEERIKELEKQLEEVNNKNKELVKLALSLKGQLDQRIKDLTH